jgi:hypothetical protein
VIRQADGSLRPTTGFIGGRAGEPLTYVDREGRSSSLAAGPPSPTDGPLTVAEAALRGNAQSPGPTIRAAAGDIVEIRLKHLGNADPLVPSDPQSLVILGLEPEADAAEVVESSLPAVPADANLDEAGNVVVYLLVPAQAGTYTYTTHLAAHGGGDHSAAGHGASPAGDPSQGGHSTHQACACMQMGEHQLPGGATGTGSLAVAVSGTLIVEAQLGQATSAGQATPAPGPASSAQCLGGGPGGAGGVQACPLGASGQAQCPCCQQGVAAAQPGGLSQ